MTRRFFLIYSMILVLSLCVNQSLYASNNESNPINRLWGRDYSSQQKLRDPVASLYIHLITRPGVFAESDLKLLVPVVNDAAASFCKTLFRGYVGGPKQVIFVRKIKGLVDVYQKEYSNAPEGTAGNEARGMALDRLLDGVIEASDRSGIARDDLSMALLHGCSVVEIRISQSPFSGKFTDAEKELVEYLLRFTTHQERRRILLDSTRGALSDIHASNEIRTLYDDKVYQVFKPVLSKESIGLETFLADPLNYSDQEKILIAELNLEALCDMFALNYELKLTSLSYGIQDSLISSIAARIPGMTPEVLKEQLESIRGLRLTSLAAYASVNPSFQIGYAPLSGLAEKLVSLGGTPPAPPDFSLFTPTYEALFRLHYDILLSDLITAQEWSQAVNNAPIPSRPLSLSGQYRVLALTMERSATIRSHIRRISKQISNAMMILFQSISTGRI